MLQSPTNLIYAYKKTYEGSLPHLQRAHCCMCAVVLLVSCQHLLQKKALPIRSTRVRFLVGTVLPIEHDSNRFTETFFLWEWMAPACPCSGFPAAQESHTDYQRAASCWDPKKPAPPTPWLKSQRMLSFGGISQSPAALF